jgi:hypothetical protein
MTARRKTALMPLVAFLLLSLPTAGAYMGAYYALLAGARTVFDPGWTLRNEPSYRINHPLVRATFQPANELDRRIRREYWTAVGIVF